MAKTTAKTMRLDDSAVAILDRACGENATSPADYVSRLIEQAHRKWTTALRRLTEAGWKGRELLAACDALNGLGMHDYVGGPLFLAPELSDAQRLNDICSKWDVSPDSWSERVRAVHADKAQERDLATIVEEFWNGNDELERRLRSGGVL